MYLKTEDQTRALFNIMTIKGRMFLVQMNGYFFLKEVCSYAVRVSTRLIGEVRNSYLSQSVRRRIYLMTLSQ